MQRAEEQLLKMEQDRALRLLEKLSERYDWLEQVEKEGSLSYEFLWQACVRMS